MPPPSHHITSLHPVDAGSMDIRNAAILTTTLHSVTIQKN